MKPMISPFDCSVVHPFVDLRARLPRDLARAMTSGKGPMVYLFSQVRGKEPRVVDYLERRTGTEGSVFVRTNPDASRYVPMRAAMCLVRYAKLCGVAYRDQAQTRENSFVFFLGRFDDATPARVTFSLRATNRPSDTIVLAELTLPPDAVLNQ